MGYLKKLCEKRRRGEKSRKIKTIVRIYERFSEPKQSKQKAISLNKQVVLKKRATTTLQKNHKSFPVKYKLVGVFYCCLQEGDWLLQKSVDKREDERLEESTQMWCTWHLKPAVKGIQALCCTALTVKPLN